jgi:hypothetical protein
MLKYDLLVYLGLVPIIATIILAAIAIKVTPADADIEIRKIRIADVTMIGLLSLFIFTAILYFVDTGSAGKEIFDKALSILFTLVGTIVGYIFGAGRK